MIWQAGDSIHRRRSFPDPGEASGGRKRCVRRGPPVGVWHGHSLSPEAAAAEARSRDAPWSRHKNPMWAAWPCRPPPLPSSFWCTFWLPSLLPSAVFRSWPSNFQPSLALWLLPSPWPPPSPPPSVPGSSLSLRPLSPPPLPSSPWGTHRWPAARASARGRSSRRRTGTGRPPGPAATPGAAVRRPRRPSAPPTGRGRPPYVVAEGDTHAIRSLDLAPPSTAPSPPPQSLSLACWQGTGGWWPVAGRGQRPRPVSQPGTPVVHTHKR